MVGVLYFGFFPTVGILYSGFVFFLYFCIQLVFIWLVLYMVG